MTSSILSAKIMTTYTAEVVVKPGEIKPYHNKPSLRDWWLKNVEVFGEWIVADRNGEHPNRPHFRLRVEKQNRGHTIYDAFNTLGIKYEPIKVVIGTAQVSVTGKYTADAALPPSSSLNTWWNNAKHSVFHDMVVAGRIDDQPNACSLCVRIEHQNKGISMIHVLRKAFDL